MAEEKLPVKVQTSLVLPDKFKFIGSNEYAKAIQKFMTWPVIESAVDVPFKDVSLSRKKRPSYQKFQPFIRGAHGVMGINPNAVPVGMTDTFSKLRLIPLLKFYSPERVLSTTYQQAHKLLNQIEKKVNQGKLIKLPTNLAVGHHVISQYFYPDQKAEIAKVKSAFNQKIINILEKENIPMRDITPTTEEKLKEQKKLEFKSKEKKKETKKEKPKETKKVKITRKQQALIKSQQTLTSLFKAADSLAKPKPIEGGGKFIEPKSKIKPFMKAGAGVAATIPGGGPKSAMQLMLQMHDPFSTGLPYMKKGGRVPSKKRKPYAVGGKVYSQAIRKPKLI
jgi:hypothetical protein